MQVGVCMDTDMRVAAFHSDRMCIVHSSRLSPCISCLCIDMCIDMLVDMLIDMCRDMCAHSGGLFPGILCLCFEMCIDTPTDMSRDKRKHV